MSVPALYHGTNRRGWAPHPGACLTPCEIVAADYAAYGGDDATARVVRVTVAPTAVVQDVDLEELGLVPVETDLGDDVAALRRTLGIEADTQVVRYADTARSSGTPTTCWRIIDPTVVVVEAEVLTAPCYYSPADAVGMRAHAQTLDDEMLHDLLHGGALEDWD